jgi:alkylated DNA nucleotide flippase Atl1
VTLAEGFAGEVMAEMQAIPYGETRTYGRIADALNTAPVAVGRACGAIRSRWSSPATASSARTRSMATRRATASRSNGDSSTSKTPHGVVDNGLPVGSVRVISR